MLKHAKWITAPVDVGEAATDFIKKFNISEKVKKATLKVSAIGVYDAYVNGKRVTDAVMTPGFTSYKNRVLYQTYDVTSMLSDKNDLKIGVGQGWAVGHFGGGASKNVFADRTAVIASLDLTLNSGEKLEIVTDRSFEVYSSDVLFSDIYNGETQDSTCAREFFGLATETQVTSKLVSQDGEWIHERERLRPIKLIITPSGERVIDFGQNMTGYVEIKISGARGDRIVLHHAEVLDSDGNFYTDNYRAAKNEMTYVLSGGNDVLKPRYTFQGFRYIRLTEFPKGDIDLSSFTAIAVYSDIKRIGNFKCGNEKINQLYHNIIWGQRSNFLDIPTDCPQRDERMGWTGDAQVFCRTASINYDTEKFFTKWLCDVALEQDKNGAVGTIIPAPTRKHGGQHVSAAWGDAACVIPWEVYMAYGNKKLLKRHFPMMKKWVDHVRAAGPEEYLWLGGKHFGDWLAMDAGPDSYAGATSNDLIATAYYAYSCELLIKAGLELGYDMTEYIKLRENIIIAFDKYFMENGIPKEELPKTDFVWNESIRKGRTQTAYALIIRFGLCRAKERAILADELLKLIKSNDGKMTTGFVGTPQLLHALSECGYTDAAYNLLFEERNPSWLYSVTHGATTMWEHWNSLKEDGSFWSTKMNSFNHYAYGAVYDWIFGVSAGIKPTAAGYKEVSVVPHPNEKLGFVDADIETRFGRIRSYWYYKGDTVYYEITIPEGVSATITLPSGYTEYVGAGTFHFAE